MGTLLSELMVWLHETLAALSDAPVVPLPSHTPAGHDVVRVDGVVAREEVPHEHEVALRRRHVAHVAQVALEVALRRLQGGRCVCV